MTEQIVNGTTPATFLLPPNCDQYQWCLDWYGYVSYLPSIAGNAFFLAAFSVGLFAQIWLGIRSRLWTFTAPMLAGIVLEIVGYGGRLAMHGNVFSNSWFIMYLCCLTIAPALFTAALYLSLSRIISIYGPRLSILQPRTITVLFITCDFFSLLLQAIGGALASTATTKAGQDIGVNIMVSGLSAQVAATTAFACLCIHLAFAVRKHPERLSTDAELSRFRHSKPFRLFLAAVAVAVITILTRCAFRVAELSEGFKGRLANSETLFMVFDSAMMVVCVLVLSVAHPGVTLGSKWALGEVKFRKGRKGRGEGAELSEGGGFGPGGSPEKVVGVDSETPSETGAGGMGVGSNNGGRMLQQNV